MESSIKIYRLQNWTVTDNYAIDDLAGYLETLTPIYTDDHFQYIRPELNTTIKIALGENDSFNVGSKGAYAVIMADNKRYFYYVLNVRYVAPKTVALELGLDTVNTYWNYISTQLAAQDRHFIHRRHKDRFIDSTMARKIDNVPEDFQPAFFPTGTGLSKIENDNDTSGRKWYLVYKSDNTGDNIPVHCYAYCNPRAQYKTSQMAPTISLNPSDLLQDVWYYLVADDDCLTPGISWSNYTRAVGSNDVAVIGIRAVSGTNSFQLYFWNNHGTRIENYSNSGPISLNNTRRMYYNAAATGGSDYTIQLEEIHQMAQRAAVSGYSGPQYVETLSVVDRTDPTIIKVIELPYAPFTPSFNGTLINVPTGWTYDAQYQAFKLNDLEIAFEDRIRTDTTVDNLIWYYIGSTPQRNENRRNITVESKLYNSAFYDFRFMYDTATWSLKPEWFDWQGITNQVPKFTIDYKPTNGINSAAAFKFTVDSYHTYRDNSDYPGFMVANRNNEKPIYTSEYLNYLKYGRQYEWTQIGENIAKTGIGLATTAGLAVAGVAFSATPIGVGMVVGAIVAGASQVANSAISMAQQIQQQQHKEFELQHQAAGVSGNTDLDIFNWYSGNRLCFKSFRPTEVMRSLLADYFYYFGYADETYGSIDVNSRIWWNYIQADIVLELPNMQQEFVEDIKERFRLGVTVMHHSDAYSYDWYRIKENWESFLF